MTETLKPCPFCGGEAEIIDDAMGTISRCRYCGAENGNGFYGEGGHKLALEDWNSRPIEEDLDKKNGFLIETCHDLHDIVEEFRAECDQKDLEIKRLREALEEIQDAITLLNTEDVLEHISDRISKTLKGEEE